MAIDILFVGGTFGTTIEYVLRTFGNGFTSRAGHVDGTGSLHSMPKEFHPTCARELQQLDLTDYEISTPVYPNFDCLPQQALDLYIKHARSNNSTVFVYIPHWSAFVLNQIMVFKKAPITMISYLNQISNIRAWGDDLQDISHMQRWQRREYLSLVHDRQWHNLQNLRVQSNWLSITNVEILFDFDDSMHKIFTHCGVHQKDADGLKRFSNEWQLKQIASIKECREVESITNAVIDDDENYVWDELSEIQESLLQSSLRLKGIELLCDSLNDMPKDIKTLKKYLRQAQVITNSNLSRSHLNPTPIRLA